MKKNDWLTAAMAVTILALALTAIILLSGSWGYGMMGPGWGYGMMGPWMMGGWGFAPFGWIGMTFMWLIPILFLAALVIWVVQNSGKKK